MPTDCYEEENAFVQTDEEADFPMKKVAPKLYHGPEGERQPEEDIYVGEVVVSINTPMGPRQQPLSFEIEDATSVDEAFAMFEDYAEEEAEKFQQMLQEEMDKSRSQQRRQQIQQAASQGTQSDIIEQLNQIEQNG